MKGQGWEYDGGASEGTLTLTDANITGRYKPDSFSSQSHIIYSDDMNLTIKLEGNNVLENYSTDYINGIYVDDGTLTITGDGKLYIRASQYGIFKDR